jgi:hypothetical protein
MIKTFYNLNFQRSEKESVLASAKMFFENRYGVSVITWKDNSYQNGKYELAVLVGNKDTWRFNDKNPGDEEVYGYLTIEEVSEIMEEVQNRLPI